MYEVKVVFFDEAPRFYTYKTHAEAEAAAKRLWGERKTLPYLSHAELIRDGKTWQVWVITNRGTDATNEIIRAAMGGNER